MKKSKVNCILNEKPTYLTGRYVSFRIYPLSFSEYLEFRKEYTTPGDTYKEFKRYLRMGGFPALQLKDYTYEEAYTVVKDIYNSTIFTDIVRRNQIRKIDQLERVVKYTFSNVGQTFSALTLSKYLKSRNRQMDPETVYNYLSKLETAYILHRCSRYDIKGKLDSAEVDFVAIRKDEKIYVQISEKIEREETERREYGNLLSIEDNYPKYVLRTDEFAEGNYEGIKTMNVADFLLSREY